MSREHIDLIAQCKAAPDIETALEIALDGLITSLGHTETRKALAVATQLPQDREEFIDAILDHVRVFKAQVTEQRSTRMSSVPHETVLPAPSHESVPVESPPPGIKAIQPTSKLNTTDPRKGPKFPR